MLTLTSNEQVEQLIKNGVLKVPDDVEIAFDGLRIDGHLECHNIYCKNESRDIHARDIRARNIDVWDVKAWNIICDNIKAATIRATNIDAGDINYLGVCFAVKDIECKSFKKRHHNSKHFSLIGEIKYKEEKK